MAIVRAYTCPKVIEVCLDPKQALQQVCSVGGVFLPQTGYWNCATRSRTGLGTNCNVTPKGAVGGGERLDNTAAEENVVPS